MKKHKNTRSALKKIILVLLLIISILLIVIAVLDWPDTDDPGTSNGLTCTRDHIWFPKRLNFKGCKTVTGVIKGVKIEKDGDDHFYLQLDPQYRYLLTSANYQKQHGTLVIEDVCWGPSGSNKLAAIACRNYHSPYPVPQIGKHYEITGNYVTDKWHQNWAEIHGLSEIKIIP